MGSSPWGLTESDIIEPAGTHFSTGARADMKIRKSLFLSFF